MILVDTSIWVDHLRTENDALADLLKKRRVLSHPYVVGELALGGIDQAFLYSLLRLPRAKIATPEEVLTLIQSRHIAGRGIGYVDVHLLAAARLMAGATVWTRDKSLRHVADDMGVCAKLDH